MCGFSKIWMLFPIGASESIRTFLNRGTRILKNKKHFQLSISEITEANSSNYFTLNANSFISQQKIKLTQHDCLYTSYSDNSDCLTCNLKENIRMVNLSTQEKREKNEKHFTPETPSSLHKQCHLFTEEEKKRKKIKASTKTMMRGDSSNSSSRPFSKEASLPCPWALSLGDSPLSAQQGSSTDFLCSHPCYYILDSPLSRGRHKCRYWKKTNPRMLNDDASARKLLMNLEKYTYT